MGCLRALGAEICRDGDTITVFPIKNPTEDSLLDCGESGSTLRFLLPVAAALCQSARFTGKGRLPERPIVHLADEMKKHGVAFSAEKLPFQISGRLTGGAYFLPGNVSSQYITGLLLALPLLSRESTLNLTSKLESGAYVRMTLSALERFGIHAEVSGGTYAIPGGQTFSSSEALQVDSDWSNAAFFLAAGALGGKISLTGLDLNSSQSDRAILDLLRRFGAEIEVRGGLVTVSPGKLRGCEIDVAEIPDLLPVLSVVAACSAGETRFTNAGRLRLKESDRLTATAALISSLGGTVTELPDGLLIGGGKLSGGVADSFRDHRIAMSAAVAACRCARPVTILGADAVRKSYPAFFEEYAKLGGRVHVL
ncbi:3-phosphoshikimate 1-carboxyvinyltransferase [bioreactor metagenome]|uniref:3-phosphoshikimate 1-carboxyvinyltransferase n=1 Tax=bioreactor metagenome TaxID=1076179 RepID=A0A644XUP3_9ZZZZ